MTKDKTACTYFMLTLIISLNLHVREISFVSEGVCVH